MRFRVCSIAWVLLVVAMLCARADDCFKQDGSNLVFAGCTKSSTTIQTVSKEFAMRLESSSAEKFEETEATFIVGGCKVTGKLFYDSDKDYNLKLGNVASLIFPVDIESSSSGLIFKKSDQTSYPVSCSIGGDETGGEHTFEVGFDFERTVPGFSATIRNARVYIPPKSDNALTYALSIGIPATFVVIVAAVLIIVFLCRRRKRRARNTPNIEAPIAKKRTPTTNKAPTKKKHESLKEVKVVPSKSRKPDRPLLDQSIRIPNVLPGEEPTANTIEAKPKSIRAKPKKSAHVSGDQSLTETPSKTDAGPKSQDPTRSQPGSTEDRTMTRTKTALSKQDTDGTELRIELQGSQTTDDTQRSPPRRPPTPLSDSHLKTALHMHKHVSPCFEMLESTADSKSSSADLPATSVTNEDGTVSSEYAIITQRNAEDLLPGEDFRNLRVLLVVPDFVRRYLIFFKLYSPKVSSTVQLALQYINMPWREIGKADYKTLKAELKKIQAIANDVYRFESYGYKSAEIPWSYHSWEDIGLLTTEQLDNAFNCVPLTALQCVHLLEAYEDAKANHADLKSKASSRTVRAYKIMMNLKHLLRITMSVPHNVAK